VVGRDDRWVVAALQSARVLSLESMAALESFVGVPRPVGVPPAAVMYPAASAVPAVAKYTRGLSTPSPAHN
jgi:hypothetical protein